MAVLMAILIAIICVTAIALPLVLLVYIYKDAQARNMNGLLWVLISLILPVPIGLIVYLVAREQSPAARCSNCGETVKSTYVVCPKCCAPLHSSCANCGYALQPGWKICPRCGSDVTNASPSEAEPGEKQTHLGRNIIIVVVSLLAVIIVSAILLGTAALINLPQIIDKVEEVCSVDVVVDDDDVHIAIAQQEQETTTAALTEPETYEGTTAQTDNTTAGAVTDAPPQTTEPGTQPFTFTIN